MDKSIKNSKKLLIVLMILLAIAIGFASAYFQPQVNSPFAASTTVITKTTDVLTFSKGNNISLTMTQQNFGSEAGNLTGSSTVMASLLANNDTNSASNTYNVYFNITGNSFHYTTAPTNTPEILLTVTNPSGSPVTSISGLTYTTVNGVSGFDITEKKGLIQIANNYSITSNSGVTATTQTWGITITIVNLDTNQQDNTNKRFSGQAIIQKDAVTTAMLDTGQNVNAKMKTLANNGATVSYSNTDNKIAAIKRDESLPSGFTPTTANTISTSTTPVYIWYEGDTVANDGTGTIYFYSSADIIYLNTDCSGMFFLFSVLNDIDDFEYFNTSYVNNMSIFLGWCGSLYDISSLANWDVSSVTNMSYMFNSDRLLTSLSPLSNWDVSSVTDMSGIFLSCNGLSNVTPLSNWNVSSVTNMDSMFSNWHNLSSLSGISNWDVSSVTDMGLMFSQTSITSLSGLENWDVSSVTYMHSMFYGCTSLTSLTGLENWDVSSVTNMSYMFTSCMSLTDALAINDWNITNVVFTSNTSADNNGFYNMFDNANNVHPTFSKRAGTWDAHGSFIPS